LGSSKNKLTAIRTNFGAETLQVSVSYDTTLKRANAQKLLNFFVVTIVSLLALSIHLRSCLPLAHPPTSSYVVASTDITQIMNTTTAAAAAAAAAMSREKWEKRFVQPWNFIPHSLGPAERHLRLAAASSFCCQGRSNKVMINIKSCFSSMAG
jgi:hypothetical protein